MYLSAYHFEGDPTALTAAYERLLSAFPVETLLFQVCAVGDKGVTIVDACPDKETHARFAVSSEFRGALEAAGLPEPRIQVLGDVPHAYVRATAVTVVGAEVPA